MRETTWFGLAIVLSAVAVVANLAFDMGRTMFVGGLFVISLGAATSLRGEQTNFGRMLFFTTWIAQIFAFVMSLYIAATDKGTMYKLSFFEVLILMAIVFGLISLAISAGACLLALVASRYQRKHAALSVGLTLFVVTVSITLELREQWKRRQPHVPPTTIQLAPPQN